MIKTKSVWSPIDRKKDGLRILVTRFRGRGMLKTRYDVWMPSLGPSEHLLKSIHSGKISWNEFKVAYKRELWASGGLDKHNQTIKNHGQKFTLRLLKLLGRNSTVTLMCHCSEDQAQCHRHILKSEILSKKI